MCKTVLRVTYIRDTPVWIPLEDGVEVIDRVKQLQDKDQTIRIEVYQKMQDLKKEVIWEDKLSTGAKP